MENTPQMPEEYAAQQFHNVHLHDHSDYERPEWYEMPQVAQHFSSGGSIVDRALTVARNAIKR
jgi:hypothetical protein